MKKLRLGVFLRSIKLCLFLGLAALVGGFFWWRWAVGAAAPKLKIEEKIFVVDRGESTSSIAQRLYHEGLIRSSLAFRLLIAKEGFGKRIQAGDFRLNSGMTPLEIAQELTHGTLDVWVTIPEGWRREEIAEKLNSEFRIQNSEFLEETREVEGYLFPDTYLIPKEATVGAIVKIFLKNFDKKFDQNLRQEAEKQGLAVKQVLTLASIVEREAKHDEDRPMVAGILIKRWKADWPLQADASVQYAKANQQSVRQLADNQQLTEWWPKNLTKEDLKVDSPYNTYLYRGLAPTPICNPGLASIKAVIFSQLTDYWYYLSDLQGQMHYAETNEEHAENINKYLR